MCRRGMCRICSTPVQSRRPWSSLEKKNRRGFHTRAQDKTCTVRRYHRQGSSSFAICARMLLATHLRALTSSWTSSGSSPSYHVLHCYTGVLEQCVGHGSTLHNLGALTVPASSLLNAKTITSATWGVWGMVFTPRPCGSALYEARQPDKLQRPCSKSTGLF